MKFRVDKYLRNQGDPLPVSVYKICAGGIFSFVGFHTLQVRYCAFLPKDYINPNATIVAYEKVFGGVIPVPIGCQNR